MSLDDRCIRAGTPVSAASCAGCSMPRQKIKLHHRHYRSLKIHLVLPVDSPSVSYQTPLSWAGIKAPAVRLAHDARE